MKRQYLPIRLGILCLSLLAGLGLASCRKNEATADNFIQIQHESNDHWWYYLTSRGLTACSLPQDAVLQLLRPWTENLRVADATTDRAGNGLVLVNRLGVLVYEGKSSDAKKSREPIVLQDVQLFSNTTAEHIVFDGKNPYVTLYKSSFFNKEASPLFGGAQPDAGRAYLVRISPANQMLYPVITYGDLGVLDGGEVTSSYFDGTSWLLSVKTTDTEKTDFRYISWQPLQALETLPPFTKAGKINYQYVTEDTYRATRLLQPLSKAPDRLRRLLSSISTSFHYDVLLRNAGIAGEYRYTNSNSDRVDSQAYATMTDSWICAIFADGTSYFCGAVGDKPLLADGNTVAFRLPKLPKSYYYTNFCIAGNNLIVGWEERDFYKTARSGILVVDMEQVFYAE